MTGAASTDWHDAANWDTGVPTGTLDVLVNNNNLPNPLVLGSGTVDLNGHSIAIGTTADGTMTISGGAGLTSGQSTITAEPQSTSAVTVTGDGSLWTTDHLVIGYEGQATLTIENGGVVTSNEATIARNGGASLLDLLSIWLPGPVLFRCQHDFHNARQRGFDDQSDGRREWARADLACLPTRFQLRPRESE